MKNFVFRFFLFVLLILFGFFLASCDNKSIVKNDDKWKDDDTTERGNFEFILGSNINFKSENVVFAQREFRISVFSKIGPKEIRIIVCHDSEDAAFDSGLQAIKDGGVMVAFENREKRNLYDFWNRNQTYQDPNRIFIDDCPFGPLTKTSLNILLNGKEQNEKFIVALHNNDPKGSFDLTHLKKWKNVFVLSEVDPDEKSLVWLCGEDEASGVTQGRLAEEIEFYKKAGMNVVYECVPKDKKNKGSLSNYAVKNKIPYINIEVRAGVRCDPDSEREAMERQIKYLNKVREFHNL